jgi:hypothetical protein
MARNKIILFSLILVGFSHGMQIKKTGNVTTITNQADQVMDITLQKGKSVEELHEESLQGIAPAMFKYSVYFLKQNRVREGLHWYFSGLIRTRQDIACSTDLSVAAAVDNIKFQMASHLQRFNIQDSLTKECFNDAFTFIEKMTKDEKLPSPAWVEEHGMKRIIAKMGGPTQNTLLPTTQWTAKRKEVLEEYKKAILEGN